MIFFNKPVAQVLSESRKKILDFDQDQIWVNILLIFIAMKTS